MKSRFANLDNMETHKLERGTKVEVAIDATTWGNRPAQIAGMVGRVVRQLSRERVSVRVMSPIVVDEVVMRTDVMESELD